MSDLDPRLAVAKLDETNRDLVEAAVGWALDRTHYDVEIEHWLAKLIKGDASGVPALLRDQGLDTALLHQQLLRQIDSLKTGCARVPGLSPALLDLIQNTWLFVSLTLNARTIGAGHMLHTLVADTVSGKRLKTACPELAKLDTARLLRDLPDVAAAAADTLADAVTAATAGGTALARFTTDLTEQARQGKIDPVLGREREIRQVVDILTRRRQNNPIMTGEPGVGKTAVVEGFALRIAAGNVPDILRGVSLLSLDLGLLQAGAGTKGEFENRLKAVIKDVHAAPQPIILFIDEAHTLIGAGGAAGQNDAANLLKPALARGELRTIAATTWSEYKKYFERDAALARRFQVVKVEEPDEPTAIAMMQGGLAQLERHHGVRILNEAAAAAVRLSVRYIPGRQLPDKSVSLLDTACARVAMSQRATPDVIEDGRRRLDDLDREIRILSRELATQDQPALRKQVDQGRAERDGIERQLKLDQERWRREKTLVAELIACRDQIEAVQDAPADLTRYQSVQAELASVQQDRPMVFAAVDATAVADVVANWTGIPLGSMQKTEISTVTSLRGRLGERVVGQPHALDAIDRAVRMARTGLTDPRKPQGVFLMCGTSGVGKTETALALADMLYGGEQTMTVINMSEFKEEHKVSLLMGSPPGYVGYGEGGVLTEAVRRRPYSVILLDEMEKAHPGVQDVFYQVFDKGRMKDGEGRDIDFRNTLIIMTSNAGTDTIAALCADPDTMPDADGLTEALRPDLLKVFKPAFLGRCTVVPYFPLSDESRKAITRLTLDRVRQRVARTYQATVDWHDTVENAIAARCTDSASGAREIERIVNRLLLPRIADLFLLRLGSDDLPTAITIDWDDAAADFAVTAV